jgi:hypothetical protein
VIWKNESRALVETALRVAVEDFDMGRRVGPVGVCPVDRLSA